jgi:hypothetical protein
MFRSEREEVTGGWRKAHSVELFDFHCLQNYIYICVCARVCTCVWVCLYIYIYIYNNMLHYKGILHAIFFLVGNYYLLYTTCIFYCDKFLWISLLAQWL